MTPIGHLLNIAVSLKIHLLEFSLQVEFEALEVRVGHFEVEVGNFAVQIGQPGGKSLTRPPALIAVSEIRIGNFSLTFASIALPK